MRPHPLPSSAAASDSCLPCHTLTRCAPFSTRLNNVQAVSTQRWLFLLLPQETSISSPLPRMTISSKLKSKTPTVVSVTDEAEPDDGETVTSRTASKDSSSPGKKRLHKWLDSVESAVSTPSKDRKERSEESSPPTSASPSKRKREHTKTTASPSSRKTGGAKWTEWEDQIIRNSIVINGEKGTDWHDILEQINSRRGPEEARTFDSLRFHWAPSMRAKMLQP